MARNKYNRHAGSGGGKKNLTIKLTETGPNPKQEQFLLAENRYVCYGGARGGGKAQPLSEPVLTPFGFRAMGDITVGSYVCNPDGGVSRVIAEYPQGVQPVYKIKFIDGAETRATPDHLWLVSKTCRRSGFKLATTQMMYDEIQKDNQSNMLIPIAEPVTFTRGKCGGLIKPYTLGVLLGDGCLVAKHSTVFTTKDEDLITNVRADGYTVTASKQPNGVLECYLTGFVKERNYLKSLGLCVKSNAKFIPERYLYTSVEERYALLRGLMDTDGTADKRGHCSFASVSKQLAEGVQWLVRSLGGKATITTKQGKYKKDNKVVMCQTVYTVYIQTKENTKLFSLPRKKERCLDEFNGGVSELCRRIVSIEPDGYEECKCIAVDAPNALYITRDFVVTHNTWSVIAKAVMLCANPDYAGIRILIIRRKYTQLEDMLISPICRLVPQELGTYNGSVYTMFFFNGSTIKFGHLNNKSDINDYQGKEYDVIFMDEATQFLEEEFRALGACIRGVNDFPKRFYLTCNPGGIGHQWVKRLFVKGAYQNGENPDDYLFIPATVYDNTPLMASSPDYVKMLDLLPESMRKAHRDGDWDALSGQYFDEFRYDIHTCEPFRIPDDWIRYRAIDYGLDMFPCLWIAVDYNGRTYVYREFQQGKDNGMAGLLASEAAEKAKAHTLPGEQIAFTIAPPDLWSTQKDTGHTIAELFFMNGVPLVKANNSRVQGWMMLKEYLRLGTDGKPMLYIFRNCKDLIENLPALQADEDNPNDCSTEPHDITHICDALRYFVQFRTLAPKAVAEKPVDDYGRRYASYDDYMTGGSVSRAYIDF